MMGLFEAAMHIICALWCKARALSLAAPMWRLLGIDPPRLENHFSCFECKNCLMDMFLYRIKIF